MQTKHLIHRKLNSFPPYLRKYSRIIIAGCGLLAVVCFSAVAVHAASGSPEDITNGIDGLTAFIYNKLRWPICALAITASLGVAKYTANGRNRALGILGGTFVWAMAPSIVAAIKFLTE